MRQLATIEPTAAKTGTHGVPVTSQLTTTIVRQMAAVNMANQGSSRGDQQANSFSAQSDSGSSVRGRADAVSLDVIAKVPGVQRCGSDTVVPATKDTLQSEEKHRVNDSP